MPRRPLPARRRRPGIANAATAPRPTTTAPTTTAVFIPSENACALSYPPRPRRSRRAPRRRRRRRARGSRCWHPTPGPPRRGRTAESTTFATGAKKSAMPTPATMNGAISCEYETVGVDTSRDPGERERLQRQARADDQLGADPVGQRARDRRDEHRRERPRQDPQPGAERRVALHGLEELREQEDRAEHAEEHEQATRRWRA